MAKNTALRRAPWLDIATIDAKRFRLPPRRVLVSGGTEFSTGPALPLASAEIYDPATNTFAAVPGGMTASRLSHASVWVGSEQLLLTGGLSQVGNRADYARTAELYSGGQFVAIASMIATRAGHQATRLVSGRALVTGGIGLDIGDPASIGFRTHSSAEYLSAVCAAELRYAFIRTQDAMSDPRVLHSATALRGRSELIVIGGGDGRGGNSALRTAEIYHQGSDSFESTDPMNHGRLAHTATLLNDGRVLVCGGNGSRTGDSILGSAEIFDPLEWIFANTGSLKQERDRHTATLLDDGRVLITGGFGAPANVRKTTEFYDPAAGTFTRGPDMRAARVYHTATALGDGRVLIAGGHDTGGAHQSAEVYDPATEQFRWTGGMTSRRCHHAASAL